MGDEEDRRAGLGDDRQHLVLQTLAGHRVERSERLVHQEDRGILRETAGDLDALLHAARHLGRILRPVAGEADLREQALDAILALGARRARRFERKRHVLGRGAPRQERLAVVLEDDRHVAPRRGQLLAEEPHGAGIGPHEPAGHPQRCRLAATGGADDADDLPAGHAERQILDDRAAAEGEGDAVEGDDGRRAVCPARVVAHGAPTGISPP